MLLHVIAFWFSFFFSNIIDGWQSWVFSKNNQVIHSSNLYLKTGCNVMYSFKVIFLVSFSRSGDFSSQTNKRTDFFFTSGAQVNDSCG